MTGLQRALRELPDAAFVDVLERDDAYRFVVDLPGVTAEDVTLSADAGRLSIEATRTSPGREETRYVEARRDERVDVDLPLPPDATADGATATMERGVLTVTVPKRSEVGGTEIEIEDT